MPPVLGIDLANAGAITHANRIGVVSGITISRGLAVLNEKRRRASVLHAERRDVPAAGRSAVACATGTAGVATAVIGDSLWSVGAVTQAAMRSPVSLR